MESDGSGVRKTHSVGTCVILIVRMYPLTKAVLSECLVTSIHPQRNNSGNNSAADLFLFKYLSPGSPTATSFKKEIW